MVENIREGKFNLVGLIKGTSTPGKFYRVFSRLSNVFLIPLHAFMAYLFMWFTLGLATLFFPQINPVYLLLTFEPIVNGIFGMTGNPLILIPCITLVFMIHEMGHATAALGFNRSVPYILCMGVYGKYFPVIAAYIKGEEKEFSKKELFSIYNGGNLSVFLALAVSFLVSFFLPGNPFTSTFSFSAMAVLAFNVLPFSGTDTYRILTYDWEEKNVLVTV
ncbi:MAG: hypothetical protein J7K00_01245 [Candidatus Diapherotrites archaeon]|nr:hypothetical protein [Candidatus Diapherotrites archaeon]